MKTTQLLFAKVLFFSERRSRPTTRFGSCRNLRSCFMPKTYPKKAKVLEETKRQGYKGLLIMRKKMNLIFIVTCLAVFALALSQTVNAQQSPIVGSASTSVVRIDIYSYSTKSTISYSPYTPSHSGYIWAWIDISFANTEADNVNTNPQYTSLKDSQNNVYTGQPMVSDPQVLVAQDLSCGNSARGNIYFEIPANANIVSFTWNDNSHVLVISAGSSTTSPTPGANSTPTPTSASSASPTQNQTATSTPTLTSTATPQTNQNSTPTPAIPEFPQTMMLLIVAAMLLVVTSGLVAYRRRNSFIV